VYCGKQNGDYNLALRILQRKCVGMKGEIEGSVKSGQVRNAIEI
jgi:hypothetical protein